MYWFCNLFVCIVIARNVIGHIVPQERVVFVVTKQSFRVYMNLLQDY